MPARRWARRLHTDDRHHVLRAMSRLRSGRFYTIEYRIIDPVTGSIKWIKDIGFPITNDRIGGVAADVPLDQDGLVDDHSEQAPSEGLLVFGRPPRGFRPLEAVLHCLLHVRRVAKHSRGDVPKGVFALGEPRLVQTVVKRGYRLATDAVR